MAAGRAGGRLSAGENETAQTRTLRHMPLRLTGVHHVAFVVDDVDAARAFYRDTLGLAEIERPPFKVDGFWMQVGEQQLHVAQGTEPAHLRNHFAFAVDDLEDACTQLEAAGISVSRGRVPGGNDQASVRDPWGNLIELIQQ